MTKLEAIQILRSVWAAPGGSIISSDQLKKIEEDARPNETVLYTVMRVAGVEHLYEQAVALKSTGWMDELCARLEIENGRDSK